MHMADALISPAVGGTMWAASAGIIGYCSKKMKVDFDEHKIDCLLSEFHLLSAKKLGLIATSNYLYDKYKPENDEDLIHLVWKVKPIFSKVEIICLLLLIFMLLRDYIECYIFYYYYQTQ